MKDCEGLLELGVESYVPEVLRGLSLVRIGAGKDTISVFFFFNDVFPF